MFLCVWNNHIVNCKNIQMVTYIGNMIEKHLNVFTKGTEGTKSKFPFIARK